MKTEEQVREEAATLHDLLSEPAFQGLTMQLLIRRLISALEWVVADDSDKAPPVSQLIKAILS